MNLRHLRTIARPYGIVMRNDLVPESISASAWVRAHSSGLLTRLHRGVSRITDVPTSFEQAALAGVLAVGHNAVAAGPTAARLWGAELADSMPIHVVVSSPVRGRAINPRPRGTIVHRSAGVLPPGRTHHHVPVTNPLITVLDTARWSPSIAASVLEQLLVADVVRISALRSHLVTGEGRGRPGALELQRLLDGWALEERPPDSVLEARMAELVRRYGLPTPEFQRRIGPYRADFTWPADMAVLECDGWTWHGRRRQQFERDRARDAWFHARGYVVWRYSWSQITNRPSWVAEQLRAALEVRRRQLGGSGTV